MDSILNHTFNYSNIINSSVTLHINLANSNYSHGSSLRSGGTLNEVFFRYSVISADLVQLSYATINSLSLQNIKELSQIMSSNCSNILIWDCESDGSHSVMVFGSSLIDNIVTNCKEGEIQVGAGDKIVYTSSIPPNFGTVTPTPELSEIVYRVNYEKLSKFIIYK